MLVVNKKASLQRNNFKILNVEIFLGTLRHK